MKKRIHYLIIALIISVAYQASLSAQIGPIKNTVIPPSPTSAVFRQFTGYTPSLATGSVNIPIDLYNINVGDFNLPISLQYYTSGIKFTDDPYPSGYGWILSPGLRITRTIMGRPDMYYPMDIRANSTDFEYLKRAIYDSQRSHHAGWGYDRLLDTQHDIYTIHLPHSNHLFLIEKVGNTYVAVTESNQLKITPNGLLGFEVVDDKGIIYHFGTTTGASPNNACIEYINNYQTAWMLRKIEFPGSSREINLTWEEMQHSKLTFGPYFSGDVLIDSKEVGTNIDSNPTYTSAEHEGLLVYEPTYNKFSHLKQISFPGGTVDFSYRATNNPLITDIKVKNTSTVTVKTIDFEYGTGQNERLLMSITKSDEGKYAFNYHSKRFNDGNKYSQDYWGYFNEKNNTSLVPRMEIKTYNNIHSTGQYQYYGSADRSVNPEAMKAYMLNKVTYPTGGYTSFEYEPHRFNGSIPQTAGLGGSSKQRLTQGGGLRVTRMTTSAGESAPVIVKTYVYGNNENGLANVLYEPTLDTFIDESNAYMGDRVQGSSIYPYTARILNLNSQSNYMRYVINTPAIWYNTVTEYVNNESKTVYTYQRHVPENTFSSNTIKDFPNRTIVKYSNLFSKGCLPTGETQFLKTGSIYTPLRETVYTYSLKNNGPLNMNNLFINRTWISKMANGPDFEVRDGSLTDGTLHVYGSLPQAYTKNSYSIESIYEELTRRQTTHYNPNGNIVESASYTYADRHLVRTKTSTQSNGNSHVEQYLYPVDYAQANTTEQRTLLSTMLSKNINSIPFKVTSTVNGNAEQIRTEFKNFGYNLYLPYKEYYKKGNSPEVCRNEYDYDIKGNLASHTQNSTLKRTYLWGYNYNYPVAVIEGMDYAQVLGLISQYTLNDLNNTNNTWMVESAINTIRRQINGRGLITSYKYQPLVGIISVTDPADKTTYYTYDNRGRLITIKNLNNKKLQDFAYHRVGEDLSVTFSTSASYTFGDRIYVTAETAGGSGQYSYVWTMRNSGGVLFYTSPASESPTPNFKAEHSGNVTLTCTVTDKMTNEIATYSRTFSVSNPIIKFSGISNSSGSSSATLQCPTACTLEIYLNAQVYSPDGEAYARFNLGGQTYYLYGSNGQSVSINLPNGSHSFNVSLIRGSYGDQAGIYINAIYPNQTIGFPSSIVAQNY